MDIGNLTINQAREIANLFGQFMQSAKPDHPFVGKYVLCRCYGAGVHSGILVSMNGSDVILKNSRRLYTWRAISGVALSGVAQTGFAKGQKVDVMNPLIALTDVIECIPCIDAVQEQVNAS